MDAPIRYRRLRAPRGQGETLIDPPLDEAGQWIAFPNAPLPNPLARGARGLSESSTVQLEFAGKSFDSLRLLARAELVQAAWQYSSQYRNQLPENLDPSQPIVVAGHQPELFHPGVWYKNIVLHELADRHTATAVNLVIDNDTLAAPAIRVPSGSLEMPRVESVAFDRVGDVIPYEQREVIAREFFAQFPDRVKQTGGGMLPNQLILDELWPSAVELSRGGMNLGAALAAARHRYEQTWGLRTLELPLGMVCQGEAFRRFLLHLLTNLSDFRRIYNESLAEYRRVNKLRSRSHPAPDLEAADDFLEAPFWIWSNDSPRREHLYARRADTHLELADLKSLRLRVAAGTDASFDDALQQLDQLEQEGIHLRPRALITTMFARLFLGDLFVHGIGGAKYDQLTDAIIERFFGIVPPPYLTVSATVYPPYDLPEVVPADLARNKQQLRELEYHPEKHVDLEQDAEARKSAEAKRAVLASISERPTAEQHRAIASANESLGPYVASHRETLIRERHDIEADLRRRRMLHSREFSFCLFSAETLRGYLM